MSVPVAVVPWTESAKTRSIGKNAGASGLRAGRDASASGIAARNSPIPSPVIVETAYAGASPASEPRNASRVSSSANASSSASVRSRFVSTRIVRRTLRYERIARCSCVCGDDEEQDLHACRSGQHVVQKAFVAGNVDDPRLDTIVEPQVREPEIERHPAQLLFAPAVRIGSGQRSHESRLTVIDVSGRAEDVHGEFAVTTRTRARLPRRRRRPAAAESYANR